MLAENEPVPRVLPFKDFDRLSGEAEARHEIRYEGEPAAKNFGAFFFAVRLIDHTEHRRRMGVIDEFVRQKRVQHDLDRRVWRCRVDQVGALNGDQLFIGDRVERAQLAQRRKAHRRQPFRLGRRHVGSRRFHPQHLNIFAEQVARVGL